MPCGVIQAEPLLTSQCDSLVTLTSQCDSLVTLTSQCDSLVTLTSRTDGVSVRYPMVVAAIVDQDAADIDALGGSVAVAAALSDSDDIDTDVLEAAPAVSATLTDTDAADVDSIGAAPATMASIADADAPDADNLTAAPAVTASIADSDVADVDSLGASVAVSATLADADGADVDSLAAAPAVAASLADTDGVDADSLTAAPAVAAALVDTDGVDTDSLAASSTYHFVITPASTGTADLYYDLSLAPAGFWSHVRSNGGDIRVTAQDGTTQLAREVSGFDYAGHKGSLFIGMGAATSCYIYYGNPSATEPAANSTYGKYAVWESAAKLVSHGADLNDATSNQNNGSSPYPPSIVDGKIGKALSFDGASTYLTCPINGNIGVPITVSVWVYLNATSSSELEVLGFSGDQIGITYGVNSKFLLWSLNTYIQPASKPNTLTWYLLTATIVNGTKTLYVNGANPVSTSAGNEQGMTALILGRQYPAATRFFNGLEDEARIYSRALSPTEIATMYANQNNPATFWTTGAEQ